MNKENSKKDNTSAAVYLGIILFIVFIIGILCRLEICSNNIWVKIFFNFIWVSYLINLLFQFCATLKNSSLHSDLPNQCIY